MTPLVQARISYGIKLVGILVAIGGVIGAAWTALNTTGIFTPVTIALFALFSLVALITALQEFIKANPLTQIIEGDAGVQAQAAATVTLDEVHQLLTEIKDMVTSIPQPQASVSITTPPSATGNAEATTITATAGDTSTAPVLPPVTPDPTVDAIVPASPDTQESGSAVVAPAEVVPEAAPAQPTRMVLIDGTPYVPAGGVL